MRVQEEIKLAEARAVAESQIQEAKMEEIRLQRRQLELDHLELERKNQEAAELLRRTRDEQLEQTSNEIRRIHEQVLHTLSCTSLSLIPSLTFSLLSPYYRLTHCLVRYYDI